MEEPRSGQVVQSFAGPYFPVHRRLRAPPYHGSMVSRTFHFPSGVLFIVRSHYYCAIGLGVYLGFPVFGWGVRAAQLSRPTLDTCHRLPRLRLRGCHPLWHNFPGGFTFPGEARRRSEHHISRRFRAGIRFGLFRVRSPLLAESLLFSFPLPIKMLHFRRFPILTDRGCEILIRGSPP